MAHCRPCRRRLLAFFIHAATACSMLRARINVSQCRQGPPVPNLPLPPASLFVKFHYTQSPECALPAGALDDLGTSHFSIHSFPALHNIIASTPPLFMSRTLSLWHGAEQPVVLVFFSSTFGYPGSSNRIPLSIQWHLALSVFSDPR